MNLIKIALLLGVVAVDVLGADPDENGLYDYADITEMTDKMRVSLIKNRANVKPRDSFFIARSFVVPKYSKGHLHKTADIARNSDTLLSIADGGD